MQNDNKIVNGLWIGKHLSAVELLCIKSFVDKGHEFHLWTYDTIETPLPAGVIPENAEVIIPWESVFCYRHKNQYGHGKGSYAGFSDIFRYKLLYDKGGWWVDMDVVCLKPLDFENPYVFRTHHDFPVVGNIMKCPVGSLLMLDCYLEASKKVNENNMDWNLPIKILNKQIQEKGLLHFITELSNPDTWTYLRKMLLGNFTPPDSWYAIHLLNEEWRRNKINKNSIPKRSLIGKLMLQYGINLKYKNVEVFKSYMRLIFPWKMLMSGGLIATLKGLFIRFFWKIVRVFKKEKQSFIF